MIPTMLMLGGGAAAGSITYSPWYTSVITNGSLFEAPAPTTYTQKDGWLTAVITAGTFNEAPVPTSYLYAPTNDWLLTSRITPSALAEQPQPTDYLKAQ